MAGNGLHLRLATAVVLLLWGGSQGPLQVEAERVLGIVHFPGRSHFVVFETLFKALAARGHHVNMVSHFPQKTPVPNYRDISLKGSVPVVDNSFSVQYVLDKYFANLLQFIWTKNLDWCKEALEHPAVRELAASGAHYDVVIVEIFGSDCCYGYARKFGAPVIGITTLSNLPWLDERVGNPSNPGYVPISFLPFTPKMSLWERILNTAGLLYATWGEKILGHIPTNMMLRDYLGENAPSLSEMLRNTSLVMVNSHFSLNGARPTVPGYVEIGGLHIDKNPGELPEELRAFLEGAGPEGALLVSFGSLVRADTLPPETLQGFVRTLGALPQRVVWKVDPARVPGGVPPNVFPVSWMPQQALLSHPKMRAFVTHGGLGGTQEAVYWGVPTVTVPFFTDQRQNGLLLQERGAGRVVFYDDLTGETLGTALNAVLNDPSYRENAKKLSEQFRDRPLPPMETAVYWTEYVMRHRGAPQLRTAALDLSWYQLWLLDVAAALAAAVALLAAVVWLVVRTILRCVCNKGKDTKSKTKTKTS